MFIRSILIPSLAVCAISAPFFLSEPIITAPGGDAGLNRGAGQAESYAHSYAQTEYSNQGASVTGFGRSNVLQPGTQFRPAQTTGAADISLPSHSRNLSVQTQNARPNQIYQQAAFPEPSNPNAGFPPNVGSAPNTGSALSSGLALNSGLAPLDARRMSVSPAANMIPFGLADSATNEFDRARPSVDTFSTGNFSQVASPQMFPPGPGMMPAADNRVFAYSPVSVNPTGAVSQFLDDRTPGTMLSGMTADYGAAQTIIFSGNAYGPDLESAPLEFLPITDFNEIFRFDISANWVKQRWKRVSTNPGGAGLHGLRVALVTGTNSWDLHGSLTYFFDSQQRLQRITFRGWTGDAARLLQLLTSRYQFAAQPSHLAGFYTAGSRKKTTGGLLMKDPPVINSENPVQRLAIVMEVNNPEGSFELSEEFQSLIAGSALIPK